MQNTQPPILEFVDSDIPQDARRQAILHVLHEQECVIEFTKVNGEVRKLACTLRADLMPVVGQVLAEDIVDVPNNSGVITVWSTEHQAWRAMRTMNVIRVTGKQE